MARHKSSNVERALGNAREQHDPPTFHERLQRLLGSTTWREPMLGGGGRAGLPAAHELAAALGMARQHVCAACGSPSTSRCGHSAGTRPDPADVGPDVAIDVLLRQTVHAGKVGRAVEAALAANRSSRACRRCRPYLRIIVWAAYVQVVHGYATPQLRPGEVSEADWDVLTQGAALTLERLAEDAVAEAGRRWRKAA